MSTTTELPPYDQAITLPPAYSIIRADGQSLSQSDIQAVRSQIGSSTATASDLPSNRARPKFITRRRRNQSTSAQPNMKQKLASGWERFKTKVLPAKVRSQHAHPEIQAEVDRRRRADTAEFIGYVILAGVLLAVIVVAFVVILAVI